ncbi:hypothetical protein HP499_17330 [Paenarthrobacter sp. CM16]|uniref:hypothetical protein n=1 Tax=Paenarthrobacter sp. CM16 TaxID=2738447 RepID=UPI00155683AE|nr:hypothetical protein [Paenarthrobacter sp. CM16]NQD89549.1 hypothetical protein [Paenarthrobacter sp. CM16]
MLDTDTANHFSQIELGELQRKIHAFRRLPFHRLDREAVSNALLDVLTFGPERRAILAPQTGTYPAGTTFYRIRALQPNDHILPLRDMRVAADAWEPPASVVKAQRLNVAGESLLYTTPGDASVVVAETRMPPSTLFSLIRYSSRTPINVTVIGGEPGLMGLTSEQHLKLAMLMNFLEHEFTRDVGIGTEYLYIASEIIAKDYFDLPPEVQDAWCYPSVASRPAVNVAFRPAVARTKLALEGVSIARWSPTDDGISLHGLAFAEAPVGSAEFRWHTHGTPVQEAIFPEFVDPESQTTAR